jgi:hypothetical protein
MFPGRNPGSRTIQGLSIRAEFGKLAAAADEQQKRHARTAEQYWRSKTIQNLAFTIIITIASTVAASLATAVPPRPVKWAVVCLAGAAMLCTLTNVTRLHPERQGAHFQIARRYTALAASCRMSINKYEEKLIGDTEFQALLDHHVFHMDTLKQEIETA